MRDIDNHAGTEDILLHRVDQSGSARNENSIGLAGDRANSRRHVGRTYTTKWVHGLPGSLNGLDRGDDVRVRRTTAEVSAHALAYLSRACTRIYLQKRRRAHDLTGRAVAALEAIVLDECGLQRVKAVTARHPFDCGDLVTFGPDRKSETGQHCSPIDMHRAGSALAVVTAFLRARAMQSLSKGVEQGCPRFYLDGLCGSVQAQGHPERRSVLHTWFFSSQVRARLRKVSKADEAYFSGQSACWARWPDFDERLTAVSSRLSFTA